MYLKNLTVFGFKSFADKTSLNFQPGVSAIVGPNGCGKSNVSDAIRWVLGEQSAKALRGGEMADVIFNGTDGRKPLGMAEVSLTIGGVDSENLKAAGVEVAYNEVTLTRRVFKDGGSEYFINRVPCRLKDIQQLFMGTGVGRTSYSIMAQGNITQLLSSKPEDRRIVFEEAAGITKFKSQKKEALRKLEYTDQNLLRLNDLIREVKRQIGSLQRQAGKARRYKQLMVELQHLDTQLARHEFDQLQTDINQREDNVGKLRVEIDVCSEGILAMESGLTTLRERLTELEEEVHSLQQQAIEVRSEGEKHDNRIHFNEERMRELEAANSKALTDITQAEERRMIAESELREVAERLTASTQVLEGQREILRGKQQALLQLETETRQRQESLKQAQNKAFEAAQQLTRVRNEMNALDLQKQGNLARLEKLSAEKIQLEEERGRLEARLAEFQQNVEAEKLNVQVQRGSVEERQGRLRQLQHDLSQASHELDSLLQQQAEKRSRLNVLEQLQSEHQGFSAGALAALKQSQFVIGSLADRIRVPDQYVAAVEVALGHYLQLVLTESPEVAEKILSDLRENKRGRASVAALSGVGGEANGGSDVPQGFEGKVASTVIEADASVQSLVMGMLGRTLIVSSLADATRGHREAPGKWDYVTVTGDMLTRHGVYTGGYLNGSTQAPASILGRKNQITELKARSVELHSQVSEASRRKGSVQSEQTMLQAGLQEAQTELRAQEVAMATRQGELNVLHNSQRLLHQKIDTVVYEIQSLAAQEQEGERKREGLTVRLLALQETETAANRLVGELTSNLEEQRQQREQANASMTETKVALATEEQLCNSYREQKRPLEQRIEELVHLVQQRQSEISGVIDRRGQAAREIEESRRLIATLNLRREELNNQVAELMQQKESQASEASVQEESLRERRRRLTDLQQQRGQIEVELAQKNMAVQNLRERIQQKWQVKIDDVRSECITITIADEGPAKVHTLSPEEMASTGAATDWNAVAEQVTALQQRIDEMGPVNLVAIEEYEETEQRYKFLTTQYEDLVKAKEQLLDVINRINAQTKEMFTNTFNKIRENFRAMFVEVFGGGKADLILVNEGDVLESGIDIVARPPGKQLQSITLLSGGEQTMTAVALLFSIYQVKPSPFCVLDELDAPLDESNINRFVRILQRFLAHSQFIIITHNKRTIGMADVLYGVTMEEHGVSKIVSVKFHKADEPASTQPAHPLVPPAQGPAVEAAEDAPHTKEDTVEVVMAK